jgi:hypothetical protein
MTADLPPGTHVTGQVSGVVTDKFTEVSVQLGSESDVRGPDFVPLHRLTDVQTAATPVYVNSDATEYQPGDVVRDASGDTYWRGGGRWVDDRGQVWAWDADSGPYTPLTLLVHNGKPVPQ